MIPPQLTGNRPLFLKVYGPDADVANPGKQPVGSVATGPFFRASALTDWLAAGGNVGRALNDDLVAVDIDATTLIELADIHLPATFTVETGGGGEHRFYQCPDWNTNCQIGGNRELGSIRSSHWFVVVPPSTHPSGGQYKPLTDHEAAPIKPETLESFRDAAQDVSPDTAATGDSASTATQTDYDISTLPEIHHDDRRAEVLAILHDSHAPHTRRVWLVGFLHGAVGMSADEIVAVLDRHNRWENYDRETTRQQVRSVIRSEGRSR